MRELERAFEQDKQQWAKAMQTLLVEIAKATEASGGSLPPDEASRWRRRYRRLLEKAESECPPPEESQRQSTRGRIKRSKARNLLERFPVDATSRADAQGDETSRPMSCALWWCKTFPLPTVNDHVKARLFGTKTRFFRSARGIALLCEGLA